MAACEPASGFSAGNFALLERLFPGLAEEIRGGGVLAPEDICVNKTPSGEPALIVKNSHVHSPRDPVRESRRLVEASLAEANPAEAGDGAPVVILGFGLGYAAEAAAALAPERPLIIVEKYREILRRAMEVRDFSKLLANNRIVFVIGGDGSSIASALALFESPEGEKKVPALIKNRALVSLDEEWYGAVESRIRTLASRDNVNMATLKRFGRRWIRNLARNMEGIRDLPGVRALAGLAAADADPPEGRETRSPAGAIPVFLAAAGPSLDRAGPLLPEIAKRCIVVAVDTSLRFLVKRGVDPDFVLAVDPQFWNFHHLFRTAAPKTWLVAESAVYPAVLRLPFRGALLSGSLFPLGKFIEDRVDPKGLLGAGGSVATTAWDFARSLGPGEIWIAGLDLSFPGLKTHFRGALFEDRSHAESGRFSPSETWLVRALRDGLPFRAPANSGGQVLTDRRLSLYAAWFENRFSQFPRVRSYGLSPGSLAIAGLETREPEALLALPERRALIDSRLAAAFERIEKDFFEPHSVKLRAERYEAACSSLRRGLDSIKKAAERGAESAEKALNRPLDREKILKALDECAKSIANSEVREVAGFLFPPSGLPEAAETGDPFKNYLKSSRKLYRSLAEAAAYTLSVLG